MEKIMAKIKYNPLKSIILNHLKQGKEGDYWDFKHEWHDEINELIKDIICFANTVHDEDCYLIFGVDDNRNNIGMSKPRRKQADIIDTLSKFNLQEITYQKLLLTQLQLKI